MWGSGCRVQGLGCRVWGSGFRVQGVGFRVWGSGFGVQSVGFRVWGSRYWVQGSSAGFKIQGVGLSPRAMPYSGVGTYFRVSGFGFRAFGFGFRTQRLGFWGVVLSSRVIGVESGCREYARVVLGGVDTCARERRGGEPEIQYG